MSGKIRKRIRQYMYENLLYFKQLIWIEVGRHEGHLDDADYKECLSMYIDLLSADLSEARIALRKMEGGESNELHNPRP